MPRALSYGPIVGENYRDAMFGPLGRLSQQDVALSPDLQRQYGMGSYVSATDAQGNPIGTYHVADTSYAQGQPTSNTIEFRDASREGDVNLSPASQPGLLGRAAAAYHSLAARAGGLRYAQTPTGPAAFQPVPGEHWLGGGIAGMDRNTGQPVYNPLGTVAAPQPLAINGGGFQRVAGLPSGLGSMNYANAFGGGGPRVFQN